MKYRNLRIAWSVAWGIACEVALVTWVGSYFKNFWWSWGRHRFFFIDGIVAYGPKGETAVPLWALVALTAAAAVAPWFRWRFSLRTLLIATTLVAIVLGIVVYAVRE